MVCVMFLTFMGNSNALAYNLMQQFEEYHFLFQHDNALMQGLHKALPLIPFNNFGTSGNMTKWEQIPESRFQDFAKILIRTVEPVVAAD